MKKNMDNINNNNIIIIHTKNPTLMNSTKKPSIKNLDNNISYDDDFNKKKENNFLSQDRYLSNINKGKSPKVKNKYISLNNSPISRNYNYNSNKNINYKINKSLNNNNNINFNRGTSEKINFIKRPTYNQILSDKNLSGYSNFFINNKRAFSGEKKIRPNHLSNKTNQNSYNSINNFGIDNSNYNNNILQTNYSPTNTNPKVTKIKKVPQDEINNNNNIKNNDFYSMRNNNNQNKNNYNSSSSLNQTSPNLNIYWNHITKVKKLSNKKTDDILINNNNDLNSKYSGNLYNILNNNYSNEIENDFELPGANKTMGYLPLKKPLSSNNLNIESYQRLNLDSQKN